MVQMIDLCWYIIVRLLLRLCPLTDYRCSKNVIKCDVAVALKSHSSRSSGSSSGGISSSNCSSGGDISSGSSIIGDSCNSL